MKQFNQTISVEVSVDDIAQKLLSTFSSDFSHSELLTETIISTSLDNNTLSYLYNSLHGYTGDIDFSVGDEVVCNEHIWSYEYSAENNKYTEKRVKLGLGVIVEKDLYKTNKLKLEYVMVNSQGESVKATKWVSHTSCSSNLV